MLKREAWLRRIAIAPRLTLGVILLVAAIGKLLGDPSARISAVAFLELEGWVSTIAGTVEHALPKLELVIALGLLSGVGVVTASFAGILLGVSFLAVSSSLPAGARCSCFGILGGVSGGVVHTSVAVVVLVCAAGSLMGGLAARRAVGAVRAAP